MSGHTLKSAVRSAIAAACAVTVSGATAGCSLLSSPKPVQLYRFGAEAAASPASVSGATRPVAVSLRRIEFPEASRGDRLLGVTGTKAAYIKGARWVSPAESLFNDSLESAFNARPDQVRLLSQHELGTANRVLGLDVTTFEARYEAPGAVPTAVITVRARMMVLPERSVVSERVFSVSQPASENRVGAIVEAFDIATRDIDSQIVDWTASASN